MNNYAVKITIRNECEFLDEWFMYHISLGFINYIIYDDESSDNTKQIIQNYSKMVNIHYEEIDTTKGTHFTLPWNFVQYTYILNIDVNEFLYVNQNISLQEFLSSKYKEKYSVILIPSIDCGNPRDFKKNITNLETQKYNMLNDIVRLDLGRHKKHFFDPNNSTHNNGHYSNPINNTKVLTLVNGIKKTNLLLEKQNLILFHFRTRNLINFNKNKKKYRIKKYNEYRDNLKLLEIDFLKPLKYETNFHINYSKEILKNFYNNHGFLIIRNLFNKDLINEIVNQAKNIYKTQMLQLNLINTMNIDNDEFESKIKIMFNSNFNTFINCGKQCQHIIELWKLSLDNKILNILKFLGLKNPNISTRPVLFSNSKHISKSDINHTVPPHQDWASMQGSINSIICWLPLIDINQKLGSIALVPKSHKEGLLMDKKEGSFGLVNDYKEEDFISFDVNQGDAIFFSSFLVHKSGNNDTDNIRWSTHFRYNDLSETNFIQNGYPHSYIYKPVDEMIIKDFDTKKATKNYFENT